MTRSKIFISYSHQDERQKNKLMTQLGVLQYAAEMIELWSDQRIGPGQAWEPEIETAMAEAAIAILLISANFLTSDFILKKEVPKLLQRRQNEGMQVLPILAKACAWQAVPWLSKMQIRPKDAKPVWRSGGRYVDDELAVIALEVQGIVEISKIKEEQTAQGQIKKEKIEQERLATANAIQVELDKARAAILQPNATRMARTIQDQIQADAQRQQMERWKILQDTQTKIFAIVDSIRPEAAEKIKRADTAFKTMDEYIRSEPKESNE